jgi:hypothetical protein
VPHVERLAGGGAGRGRWYGLAATSWGPGRIDRFWVGPDGALLHAAFADGTWGPTESLGGTLAAAPGAPTWAPSEIGVLAALPGGQLCSRCGDGPSWHGGGPVGGGRGVGWEQLGAG